MNTRHLLCLLALTACVDEVEYPSFEESDTDTDADSDTDTDTDTDTDADTDPEIREGWTLDDPSDTWPWADVDAGELNLVVGPPMPGIADLEVAGETVYGIAPTSLWISADAGTTWTAVEPAGGFEDARTVGLVDGRLFVGDSQGLHLSEDGGLSWSLVADVPGHLDVHGEGTDVFAVHPTAPAVWRVEGSVAQQVSLPSSATRAVVQGGDLFALGLDGQLQVLGASGWEVRGSTYLMQVYEPHGDTLFGLDATLALVASTDQGLTWEVRGSLPDAFTDLVYEADGQLWTAAGSNGLQVSADGGATWTADSLGIPVTAAAQILTDAVHTDSGVVLAASARGDLWSRSGLAFSRLTGLSGGTAVDLAWIDGAVAATLGGRVWRLESTGWVEWGPNFDLTAPGSLAQVSGQTVVDTRPGMVRSGDGGQSAALVGTYLPRTIGPAGDQAIPLGRFSVRGRWIFAPMPRVYTASTEGGLSEPVGGGLVMSWDDGETWEWAVWDFPMQTVNVFGANVYDGGTTVRAFADVVLFGTETTGLWASHDQGDAWVEASGLPAGRVEAVAESDAGYHALVGGTGEPTLHLSADGIDWTADPLGLPGAPPLELVDADGHLFVFSETDGTLSRRDTDGWHLVATVPAGVRATAPLLQHGSTFLVTAPGRGFLQLEASP